jgi:hypothetical protein
MVFEGFKVRDDLGAQAKLLPDAVFDFGRSVMRHGERGLLRKE